MGQLYAHKQVYTADPITGANVVWLDRLNAGGPSILTGLKYSTTYPGGDTSATANLNALPDMSHIGLRDGRQLIIQAGGAVRWRGFLEQAQRPTQPGSPWQLTATGIAGLLARDQWAAIGGGNAYNLNGAVDGAIGRGLPFTRSATLPTAGTAPDGSITLDQALGDVGQATGTVWSLTAAGVITMAVPPTAPSYVLRATQPLAPKIIGWTQAVGYYDTGSGNGAVTTPSTGTPAITKFGNREGRYDMTNLGPIAAGTAGAYLATWLAANLAAPTYTQQIVVQTGQLKAITPAGAGFPQAVGGAVDLGTVRAGCLVRVLDADPSHANLQTPGPMHMLVGQTDYDVDSDTLTLTPVGYQGQDLAAIIYNALGGAQ